MELAATALAQAVGGDEGEWRASDNDDIGKLASPSHSKTKKISVVNIQPRRASEHEEKSAVLGSVSGVTIDALVGVLQDPDRGVPRALETRLKDVKIRRGECKTAQGTVHQLDMNTIMMHHPHTQMLVHCSLELV